MNVNLSKLRRELEAAGLRPYGVSLDESGELRVSFLEKGLKRAPTDGEQKVINTVTAAHDPVDQLGVGLGKCREYAQLTADLAAAKELGLTDVETHLTGGLEGWK
jgi:hypothetical protein